MLLSSLSWFVRARSEGAFDMARDIDAIRKAVGEVFDNIEALLPSENAARYNAERDRLLAQGAPLELASRIAALGVVTSVPGVVKTAAKIKRPVAEVMRRQLELVDLLKLEAMRAKARGIPVRDEYEQRARDLAVSAIDEFQFILVANVAGTQTKSLDDWRAGHARALAAIDADVNGFIGADPNLARLIVASNSLAGLARS